MRALFAIAVAGLFGASLVLCGCQLATWDAPNPPTSQYPCGPQGVVCTMQHTCCNQGDTCGGEPASVGCPVGQCCFVEPGEYGARRDGGPLVRTIPQRPQAP
ncbi:MAG: hypothetical protein ACLP1X_00140 [Polyangiaceae bacterium]